MPSCNSSAGELNPFAYPNAELCYEYNVKGVYQIECECFKDIDVLMSKWEDVVVAILQIVILRELHCCIDMVRLLVLRQTLGS